MYNYCTLYTINTTHQTGGRTITFVLPTDYFDTRAGMAYINGWMVILGVFTHIQLSHTVEARKDRGHVEDFYEITDIH